MSVLSVPGYRRLWAARTVSQWGDIAQFTALALLVFHLTGSGLGVSGVVAEIAPVLLLAPLGAASLRVQNGHSISKQWSALVSRTCVERAMRNTCGETGRVGD
jgi:hypothetical protein